MSTTVAPARQPLKLPAGSVRALLAMIIAGLFWLLLLPAEKQIPIPLFLYFLAGMVLMFFVAHGNSISSAGQPPPWGLPRGTFRFLLIVGTIAVLAAHFYFRHSSPLPRLVPAAEQLQQWPNLTIALFGGLSLGWLVGRGPWRYSAVFQDFQAWVSIVAMIGLAAEVIILLFINPSLEENPPVDLRVFESVLTGIIAWYFGSRS
jgi:hypothetical protein